MKLKIDLHVHSTSSGDAFVDPEQLPTILRSKGIDGVAITDHDTFTSLTISEAIVLPGIEVSTREGHMLGIGVSSTIPKGRHADETISLIRQAGGIAIIPHPFDPVSPCVNPSKLKSRPDAIEVINSDALLFRLNSRLARRAAERLNLPMVGGSDSHIPETVGDAYTLIDSKSEHIHDILNAIKAGFVEPAGCPSSPAKKLLKIARTLRNL
mgnify:CR=1 FL=1